MNTLIDILRRRWPYELKRFDDIELQKEYAWFKASDYGYDDERFLEWIFMTDG